MRKAIGSFFWILWASATLSAQTIGADSTLLYQKRLRTTVILGTASYATAMTGLYYMWYKDYPTSTFHFFDDSREWNQSDKYGHTMAAYGEAKIMNHVLQWSGVDRKKAIVYGALTAFMIQNSIEMYDGFSAQWGASASDIIANGIGASLYASQELIFRKQIVKLKYGLTFNDYDDPTLSARSQSLYGSGLAQRFIKDYNGTTLWLCTTPRELFPRSRLPKWLGVAVGFGNGGMFGGYQNQWIDQSGNYHDRSDVIRYRKFLLSADIDFEKIDTKNKFWNSMLFMLNFFKIPMPTMEINTKGDVLFHPLYLVQFNKNL